MSVAKPPSDTDAPSDQQPLTDSATASPVILAPTPPSIALGYVFATVGAILFSTKAIAVKLLYEQNVDLETLLALRMLLALPVYLLVGALSVASGIRTGRPLPSWRLVLASVAVGLIGYWVGSYLDFWGLQYVSAQVERMILFTYPIFVVIFGALFFGHRLTLRAVVAIAISYCGLTLIFTQSVVTAGEAAIFGAALVFASAIGSAFNQLFSKKLIDEIGPRLFTCIAMTGAAFVAALQFAVTHPLADLAVGPTAFGYALFLALGATALPSFLMSSALHRISVQATVTIGTLSPVATILLAYLILGETMTPLAWLGTALVMAGVGWFTIVDQRARRRALTRTEGNRRRKRQGRD